MEERAVSERQKNVIRALRTDDVAMLGASFTLEKINKKNGFGQTPLYFACSKGSFRCVRWLLENGADANIECGNGFSLETPLFAAAHTARSYECVNLMLRIGRARISDGVMLEAIHDDRREMTRLLLSYGGSVRVRPWSPTPPWWTELLYARKRCRRAAVVLVGIRRLRQSAVLASNGMDAIRLVAMHVWRTQLFEKWIK
jgi:hypothetical protein